MANSDGRTHGDHGAQQSRWPQTGRFGLVSVAAGQTGAQLSPAGDETRLTPKRILVYGVTGSGKTTLARRIAERLELPFIEADQLTWEPGWVEVSAEEQRRRIQSVCEKDAWVLDTAYAKWMDLPLAGAELIVALDYPRVVSFARLLKRTFLRVVDKNPICNGNQESWRIVLSRESILLWYFKSFRNKRRRIQNWISEGRNVVRLTSPKLAEKFLNTL